MQKVKYHIFNLTRLGLLGGIILVIVTSACTERIDIETDDDFQKLAVEGFVTPAPDGRVVRLTKTSGYFSQEAPIPVSEAIVTVDNGDGTYQWNESSEEPGAYFPPEEFEVKIKNEYKLTISLKEAIGGESYFEATAFMPRFEAIVDSIHVIWESDFESWIIALYAYEPPGTDYYMFNALNNGEFLTDSISRVGITDDLLVDGLYLNGIYTLFFWEDEMAVGDTISLITSTVTKDYYRYVSEAQTELFPKVPIFSGPPANVRSNISNGALGYFAAFSSDTVNTIIDGTEIEN